METALDGLVVIDKPADITSARVVGVVKRTLGAKKVGHAGTLDPLATGVMVCCINQATRLARFLLSAPKVYEAVLRLGTATDTQDLTGRAIFQGALEGVSENEVRSTLDRFVGTIEQRPPVYSALKHRGVPLYRLARSGRPVQKAARRVQIASLDVLEIELPDVRFVVSCSAGTYIRTLCADIGAALGCGGHLAALRRIESSGFSLRDAISLATLEALAASDNIRRRIIGMADALRSMPALVADEALADKIRHGMPLTDADGVAGPPEAGDGLIKVVAPENRLLAILSHDKNNGRYKYHCVFQA